LSVFDPISYQLLVPKRLPPDTPFNDVLPLAIEIPINDKGKGDIYIDDTIFICLDLGNNIERIAKAAPLAFAAITRPLLESEPLPRNSMISEKKFMAEAAFEESKTILGWIINTRSFTIHLPENKFISWCSSIDSVVSSKNASAKSLHSIEGRLNNAAYIVPTMRHFLSRLRAQRMLADKTKHQQVHIPLPIITDLYLCKNFLQWSKSGISLNLVTFRSPTTYLRSDACNHRLGGYNIYSGRAWHFQLPSDCIGRAHINTLEFMASVISIWIEIFNGLFLSHDCFLSQMDSTTAAGWLRKSNLSDSIPTDESTVMLIVAR
jgi:hypothetical protein